MTKILKKRTSIKIFSILMLSLFIMTSCSKDDEVTVDDRDKFLGDYVVLNQGTKTFNGTSQSYTLNYNTSISKNNAEAYSIKISNFFDLQDSVNLSTENLSVIVEGINIIIENQEISGLALQATGSMSSNGVITLNYSAARSDVSLNYSGIAVYTPR